MLDRTRGWLGKQGAKLLFKAIDISLITHWLISGLVDWYQEKGGPAFWAYIDSLIERTALKTTATLEETKLLRLSVEALLQTKEAKTVGHNLFQLFK